MKNGSNTGYLSTLFISISSLNTRRHSCDLWWTDFTADSVSKVSLPSVFICMGTFVFWYIYLALCFPLSSLNILSFLFIHFIIPVSLNLFFPFPSFYPYVCLSVCLRSYKYTYSLFSQPLSPTPLLLQYCKTLCNANVSNINATSYIYIFPFVLSVKDIHKVVTKRQRSSKKCFKIFRAVFWFESAAKNMKIYNCSYFVWGKLFIITRRIYILIINYHEWR